MLNASGVKEKVEAYATKLLILTIANINVTVKSAQA